MREAGVTIDGNELAEVRTEPIILVSAEVVDGDKQLAEPRSACAGTRIDLPQLVQPVSAAGSVVQSESTAGSRVPPLPPHCAAREGHHKAAALKPAGHASKKQLLSSQHI